MHVSVHDYQPPDLDMIRFHIDLWLRVIASPTKKTRLVTVRECPSFFFEMVSTLN
jgi:hypothetical protein